MDGRNFVTHLALQLDQWDNTLIIGTPYPTELRTMVHPRCVMRPRQKRKAPEEEPASNKRRQQEESSEEEEEQQEQNFHPEDLEQAEDFHQENEVEDSNDDESEGDSSEDDDDSESDSDEDELADDDSDDVVEMAIVSEEEEIESSDEEEEESVDAQPTLASLERVSACVETRKSHSTCVQRGANPLEAPLPQVHTGTTEVDKRDGSELNADAHKENPFSPVDDNVCALRCVLAQKLTLAPGGSTVRNQGGGFGHGRDSPLGQPRHFGWACFGLVGRN